MKPKTMILMVVAVGCGLGASYMTSRLIADARKNQDNAEEKISVLVAKQKISPWTPIKDPQKVFELREVPVSAAPKKALKSFDDVKDKSLGVPVSEETYLTEDHLLNKDQAGLAAQMKSGQRAIALKVNAESLAGGWVLPGSRVDLISTLRGGPSESVSKIILQDMLVLAIDTTATRDPNQPNIIGTTVTLAARPEEATRLALASSLGDIRLMLRPLGDNTTVHLRGSKFSDLDKPLHDGTTGKEMVEEASAVPPPPVPVLPPVPVAVVQKEPEPVKEPEPKKVETHTMIIRNGEYVQKAVFIKDDAEGWTNPAARGDTPPPARRPEPAPRAVPPAEEQPTAKAPPAKAPPAAQLPADESHTSRRRTR